MRASILLSMLALLVAGFMGVSSLRAAESACKGLANNACSGNSACSWVKAYKTKKGKEIAGFCRKKAAHSTKPKSATTNAKS